MLVVLTCPIVTATTDNGRHRRAGLWTTGGTGGRPVDNDYPHGVRQPGREVAAGGATPGTGPGRAAAAGGTAPAAGPGRAGAAGGAAPAAGGPGGGGPAGSGRAAGNSGGPARRGRRTGP
ncbi:hypothetical protein GCM10017752_37610 [Streptomyces roseoviridis]